MPPQQVSIAPELFADVQSISQTLCLSPTEVINEILREFLEANCDTEIRMLVRLASRWEYNNPQQAEKAAERLAILAVEEQLEPGRQGEPEIGLLSIRVSSPRNHPGFSGDFGWFLGATELCADGEWRLVT